LHAAGYLQACVIGRVTAQGGSVEPVLLKT
jgi:hypothetical protein